MRNCGESTFPKAMKAHTAAADAMRSGSLPRSERAKTIQTATIASAWSTVCTVANVSGSGPARFCEPKLETTVAS